MKKIIKTAITLIVFHKADFPINDLSLGQIIEEMDVGEAIGTSFIQGSSVVPTQECLIAELQEIGNDGTFFDDYD